MKHIYRMQFITLLRYQMKELILSRVNFLVLFNRKTVKKSFILFTCHLVYYLFTQHMFMNVNHVCTANVIMNCRSCLRNIPLSEA